MADTDTQSTLNEDEAAATTLTAPDGWEWDIACNCVRLGTELHARLECAEPQLPYDAFIERLHPDDRADVRTALFRAYRKAEGFDYDFRILVGEDGPLRLSGRAEAVADEAGAAKIIRGLGTPTPAAAPAAPLDTLIVAGAPDGCLILDATGRVLEANPAYCELLGYAPQDLRSMTLHELEEGSATSIDQRLKWLAADGRMRYETRHRHADGRWVDVELSARFHGTPDGARIVAFVRDVRERRLARDEAKRLTSYLQLLLDSAGEGIYSIDLDGRCTFINRAAQELLGYSRHEALGKDMHALLHHTQDTGPVAREDSPVASVLKSGRGVRVDDEVIWRKNGSSFAAEYSSYPIVERGKVAGAVVVFRDVTEARSMAMQLEYQASHDALTGLANRREFQIRLEHALAKVRAEERSHVLLFLDLDQFKVVNDTAGHAAGDELLRRLADQMKAMIRSGDTLARLGGDEFGILLESCGIDYALKLAERMRQLVQDFRFSWEGSSYNIGVSIGAVPIGKESVNVAALLSAADAACYSAKESGRNRVRVYRPDDTGLIRRQGDMRWIGQIHQALKEDRLRLFYQRLQPLSVPDARGQHIEMLIKMQDFEGNLIGPGAFLPAAERAGLTPDIDRWVVAKTFEWIVTHAHRSDQLALCSINLSGHSLGDPGFLDFVIDAFEKHHLPPRLICFEVTETAAIANLSNARRLFNTLAKMGCRFALDDFGSGMSSYGYLKTLPVTYLKIDGSFIKDIATDPIDYALVKSINDIGHVMGKQTIAEYVESKEILDKVKEMGVDYAQGYFINTAEPIETLKFS